MFIIRKEQLEVFRAPLRQKKRDELLLSLQSKAGSQVASQKDKIEVTDKKGRTSTLHYSEKNLLHALIKPSGARYEFDYNEDDRLSKVAFPGNESLILAYRNSLPTNIALNGANIELQYDAKSRLSHIIYPDKKGVQFQYHDNNQVAAIIDRNNAKQSYNTTIEDNRLVHRMKDALGRETTVFMNTSGSPERIIFPDKSRQDIRYDEALDAERATLRNRTERITYYDEQYARRIEWADGSFREIEVNGEQQVASLENANGTIAYAYDDKGRLLSEAFAGSELRYQYDEDYLKGMIYPDGLEVGYEYDEDDRLKNLRVGNQTCTYKYAPNGKLAEIHYPNGLIEYQTNKVLGGLQDITLKTSAGSQLYQHRYQYDQLSRLTGYQEWERGGQPVVRELSYDAESRLTEMIVRASGEAERFRYDAKGNIIQAGQQKVVVGAMDEVRSIGGADIEYDKGGNITRFTDDSGKRLRLQYADDGMLKFAHINGETWEYRYDALGRRIGKSNGKVAYRFFWSGKKLISEELKEGGRITHREYIYTDSDVPVAFKEAGQLYWLQRDVRNAITRVYDNYGKLFWQADYTAFGKTRITLAEVRQPWRLMGQYYDEESGLHYNFARHYSPCLRTFLSLDPKWDVYGSTNYTYAANDPFNKVDGDGNLAMLVAFGLFVLAALVLTAITNQALKTATDNNSNPLKVPDICIPCAFKDTPFIVPIIIWAIIFGTSRPSPPVILKDPAPPASADGDGQQDEVEPVKPASGNKETDKNVKPGRPPEKGDVKPKHAPQIEKWQKEKGGKVEVLEDGNWRYTDWEGNAVEYKDGFPVFDPHSRQDIEIEQKGNYKSDPADAEKASKLDPPRLEDNTWHHHQNGTTMQEVPTDIHNRFNHRGGVSVKKNK